MVKHFLCVGKIKVVLTHFSPWKLEHELYVVVLDAIVRRRRVILLELGKFLLESLCYFFGPFLLGCLLPELIELFSIVHTKLLLNSAELVVEVVFPLLLVNVTLDFLVDLLLDLHQFDLRTQDREEFEGSEFDVVIFEQLDLGSKILYLYGGGYEVDEELEIVDGFDCSYGITRAHVRGSHDLYSLVLE